ncbi:MAG: FkbM family methyltransferase [Chloroflexota bacterium]|nr:FkbM family methyltransferase [Chloroflexota bacterium]
MKLKLLRLAGIVLRPLLIVGVGRMRWVYPVWALFARLFFGNSVTIRADGVSISVPPDDGFGFNLLTQGSWEPFMLGLFKSNISIGMTVVDVGAHVGIYTLAAAAKVGDCGRVYAFEPVPRNYALLVQNIEANGFTVNVVPLRKAVSDKPGMLTLYLDALQSTLHSVTRRGKDASPIMCEAVALDECLGGSKVDVVKIDVEGAEMAVLQGMQRIVSENPGVKIFCEFVPQSLVAAGASPRGLLDLLTAQAFTIYKIDEHRRDVVHIFNNNKSELVTDKGCYLLCVREGNSLFVRQEQG